MATAEETYGVDIAFKADFVKTASGDLDLVSGLDNLKEAIMRRIMTSPGSIIHRPNYGVGLKDFVNSLNTLGRQQELAIRIKEQLNQEPRVEKFLGMGVDQSATVLGQVKIVVRVKPVGYGEQSITVVGGI